MTTRQKLDERVALFVAACRRNGVRVTHQRTEILRELAGTDKHPDAETVYHSLRKRLSSISLDTVYRTLRLFEDTGVIARMGGMKERARFDANTTQHHHFVCTKCGLVRDLYDEAFDNLQASQDLPRIGCVDSVHVELRGRCRTCRKKSRKNRRHDTGTVNPVACN